MYIIEAAIMSPARAFPPFWCGQAALDRMTLRESAPLGRPLSWRSIVPCPVLGPIRVRLVLFSETHDIIVLINSKRAVKRLIRQQQVTRCRARGSSKPPRRFSVTVSCLLPVAPKASAACPLAPPNDRFAFLGNIAIGTLWTIVLLSCPRLQTWRS